MFFLFFTKFFTSGFVADIGGANVFAVNSVAVQINMPQQALLILHNAAHFLLDQVAAVDRHRWSRWGRRGGSRRRGRMMRMSGRMWRGRKGRRTGHRASVMINRQLLINWLLHQNSRTAGPFILFVSTVPAGGEVQDRAKHNMAPRRTGARGFVVHSEWEWFV